MLMRSNWKCKLGSGLGEMLARNLALPALPVMARPRPSQELRDRSATPPEGSCPQCPVVSECRHSAHSSCVPGGNDQPAAFQVHTGQQTHSFPGGNGNCKGNFRALGLVPTHQEKVKK